MKKNNIIKNMNKKNNITPNFEEVSLDINKGKYDNTITKIISFYLKTTLNLEEEKDSIQDKQIEDIKELALVDPSVRKDILKTIGQIIERKLSMKPQNWETILKKIAEFNINLKDEKEIKEYFKFNAYQEFLSKYNELSTRSIEINSAREKIKSTLSWENGKKFHFKESSLEYLQEEFIKKNKKELEGIFHNLFENCKTEKDYDNISKKLWVIPVKFLTKEIIDIIDKTKKE